MKAALARVKHSPATAFHNGVHLVTQATKLLGEARPSLNFRVELASQVRATLRPLVADRQLKRAKSTTDADFEEIAATVPCAPSLPPKLAEYLEKVTPRSCSRLPHLVAIGCETYDAARAKDATGTEAVDRFETSAPNALASAISCDKANLLVAPSMHVHGTLGLFSARSFMKEEIVCYGSSKDNGWIPAPNSTRCPEYTLQLTLGHVHFKDEERRVQLVGDPNRNLWARMNSTEGLQLDRCVEPNVRAVFGDSSAVIMDNSFLVFRATRDINPFEELLWHYDWAKKSKVAGAIAADQELSNTAPAAAHTPLAAEVRREVGEPVFFAPARFANGEEVMVTGLESRPELNGSATIQSYNSETGRYVVKVDSTDVLFNVKEDNIVAQSPRRVA